MSSRFPHPDPPKQLRWAAARHLLFLGWLVAAVTIFYLFFRDHPPRPVFSEPTLSAELRPPWASHAGSLAGALAYLLLTVPGGIALARLLRLKGPDLLSVVVLGGLYATLTSFLLLSLGLFHPLPLAIVLMLPLLWYKREHSPRLRSTRRPSRFEIILLVPIALTLAALLVRVLAPLTANDALVYHMTMAKSYADAGRFQAPAESIYARMPHAIELLYAGARSIGTAGSPVILHLFLFVGNLVVAARLSRSLLGRGGGIGAALLLAAQPLLFDPRTIGNVDLGASLLFGLAALHLLRLGESGDRAHLLASALFGGGLLSVKFSSHAAYPLLVAVLLFPVLRGGRKTGARDLLLFLFVSHLLLIPWLAKGWLESGHPLFPVFLSPGSGAIGWDSVSADRLSRWQLSMGMGRDTLAFLLLPWNIALHGQPADYRFFDGTLSPLLLILAPLAAVHGGRRVRWLLLLSLSGVYLWGIGPQQLRFLAPVVLLLCALIGDAAIGASHRLRAAARALLLAGAAVLLSPFLWETARDVLPVVCGKEGREAYLSRKLQSYDAFRMLPRRVPPGEKVFLVWENRTYYSPRTSFADSFFEASQVVRMAEVAGSSEDLLDLLRQEGYRWVLVNRPLQRVFARSYPPQAVRILDEAWERADLADTWKGIELYHLDR